MNRISAIHPKEGNFTVTLNGSITDQQQFLGDHVSAQPRQAEQTENTTKHESAEIKRLTLSWVRVTVLRVAHDDLKKMEEEEEDLWVEFGKGQ